MNDYPFLLTSEITLFIRGKVCTRIVAVEQQIHCMFMPFFNFFYLAKLQIVLQNIVHLPLKQDI